VWYKRNVANPASLRKVPSQARSKERVERILEAAVQEFAEAGYEAATMDAIAARAETSIGSVYQFFPNKKAVFDAVSERCQNDVRALFDAALLPEVLAQPWPVLLDQVIDILWAFATEAPAFRAVWVTGNLSEELLEAAEALNRELAERAEKLLVAQAPKMPKTRRALVATVLVETVSAMVFVACRRGGAIVPLLRDETKALLHRYLEAELGPARKPRR
jgi:AcrR family transcriptional regulator